MKQVKVKMTAGTIITLIFSYAAALYLWWPMIAGMLSLIFQNGDINKPFNIVAATQSLPSLIVMATALGAFILWFVDHPTKKEQETDSFVRAVKLSGTFFLYSALLLSLCMILTPLIPSIKDATDWYNVSIKYLCIISLIGGSITFVAATVEAIIYAWKL